MIGTVPTMSRDEAIELNRQNCKTLNFAPNSGYCWTCGYDLIGHFGAERYATGMTVSGCPRCHRSYCE